MKSPVFTSQFTGIVLFDPETGEYLFERNSGLYFTPASNVKILTTLASLESFGDSIPSFSYYRKMDTLYIEPMGDPTVLHPDFIEQPVIKALSKFQLKVRFPDAPLSKFGPGWAWDDYQFSFQPEIAWFPIYANEVRVGRKDSLEVTPKFFKDYVTLESGSRPDGHFYRDIKHNFFHVWENGYNDFEQKIPFDYSRELTLKLLGDTLHKEITPLNSIETGLYGTLYNQPTISVLSLMMQRSDNFLAEQLLITAARKSGYDNIQAFRNHLLLYWALPSSTQWVDGSGLSRYNLLTPQTLVKVLFKIYQTQTWETIRRIFPTGGYSGTLKNWYHGDPPYVFAKTGTLSNNHSLSGYIRTDSGKVLIFSIMNNHYTRPVREVKEEMQKVLELIKKRY